MPKTLAIPDDAAHLPLALDLDLTGEQFFAFCQLNRDLRIERTAAGDIIVMPPAGGATGHRNLDLSGQLYVWARADATGAAFDSSTGFVLPNGATRSPDAAWVRRARLTELSPEQKGKFLPLCPDFAVELRSPSDRLSDLQDKMQEYVANGLRLGWLIDPVERQAFVYRTDGEVEHLKNPGTLDGEDVLPGFVLDLASIWDVGF